MNTPIMYTTARRKVYIYMHDEKRFTFASPERKRKKETVDGGEMQKLVEDERQEHC
jgi:hypothetical protein